MKRTALFTAAISLFFGISLFGETNTDELTSGYNAPARIDVKRSWNLFFSGSYIFWQPREEALELGYLHEYENPSTETSLYKMNFDYKSGIKVGLGINFNRDHWISCLEYTRLHTTDRRKIPLISDISDTTHYIVPFWHGSFDIATSTKATWKMRYDILDLTLGRPFYSGTCFILSGFGGLKGGWINQKYRIKYQSYFDQSLLQANTFYKSVAKTNSWVTGPIGGLNLKYLLGAGFRLFGDASASLLFQRLHTSVKVATGLYVVEIGQAVVANEQEHVNQITPNINLSSGFGWGSYFDKNNWHFDFSAAYDFHYYWNQNHMKRVYDLSMRRTSGKAKDFVLQGLTITAKIDF